ncbi:MAG TPA: hypothetical protein VK358_14355, partial [Longimicrobium sp.]|nr:hypothetical protein [Longimicrobium sp.]
SMVYDWWGQLRASISPLGYHTMHYTDPLGRDTLVITPVTTADTTEAAVRANGARSRTSYDVMNRVLWTQSIGPAMVQAPDPNAAPAVDPADTPQEIVSVVNHYDAKGDLRRVDRQSNPDVAEMNILITYFDYDVAGRKIEERNSPGDFTRTRYDRAGNVLGTTQREYPEVVSEYDALGRMVRRTVPGVRTERTCARDVDSCQNTPYPLHPTGSNGAMEIGTEIFYFRYDAAGNQVLAENLDSRVSRTYYPGGALRTDSIRMRAYAGLTYDDHVYGLEYRYDLAGRVSTLRHPYNLSGVAQADSFAYDAVTGEMTSARSRQGHLHGFAYDKQGRQTSLAYPGGGGERTTYDIGGRRLTRTDSLSNGAVLEYDTFEYDARGKQIYVQGGVAGGASTFRNWYSGLGNLVATDWGNVLDNGRNTELFTVDALGNQMDRESRNGGMINPRFRTTYTPAGGRVATIGRVLPATPSTAELPDSTYRTCDAAGNVEWAVHKGWGSYINGSIANNSITSTRNYYGADGMLRVVQTR